MASILIVDDAAFMRLTIKQMVEADGYSVIGEAGNGIDAVKKYSALNPDVVILDLTMPEMGGLEAIKRIKEVDPGARIVVCSAMGQQEMIAHAIQYGAQDFIVKPFEKSRLIAAIVKVLSR